MLRIAAAAAGLSLFGGMALADSITPGSYSTTLLPGESVTIKKTVEITEAGTSTSLVDVFFLVDTTGSMGGAINTVRSNLGTILTNASVLGDVASGVGEYKDFSGSGWGGGSDFPFALRQDITTNTALVQTAIDALGASGGADTPESNLEALSRSATDVGWRDGAARIVVWFGDAPGHDPDTTAGYPGPTLASTIATLQTENVSVIGVNATSGPGIDSTGQATAITTATGGSLFTLGATTDILAEIQDALMGVFAEYSSVSLQPVGNLPGVGVSVSGPILGDFDRSETRTFEFDVTFTGLTFGTHDFVINALADGRVVATERDRITVVPVPAALPLMLGGLALFGLVARRRGPLA